MELLITVGPWQSMIACAALKQMGVAPESVQVVLAMYSHEQSLVEPCRKIHEEQGHCFLGAIDIRNAGSTLDEEDPRITAAVKQCTRLWAIHLSRKVSLIMEMTKPNVPVILYEDGLGSSSSHEGYGDYWKKYQRSPVLILWVYLMRSLAWRRPWLRRPDYKRVQAVVTYLEDFYDPAKMLPAPRVQLESRYLRELLNGKWIPKIDLPPSDRPRALMAGSNFTSACDITPSWEYQLIEESIETLAKDYEVWWKPHPRADPLFTHYLKLRYPFLQVLGDELATVPVEALIAHLDCKLLLSPLSSSLVYARRLCGIETYLAPGFEKLLAKMNKPFFTQVYGLLKQHVPVLGE